MAGDQNRRIAFLFGAVAAILLIAEGVVDFVGGFVLLAFGSGNHALGAWARSVIDVVVGVIVGAFALVGRTGASDRAVTAGVILVVLAIVGWLALGLGNGILALLGALFCLIAGILYLLSAR